jgi:hypothetical protein
VAKMNELCNLAAIAIDNAFNNDDNYCHIVAYNMYQLTMLYAKYGNDDDTTEYKYYVLKAYNSNAYVLTNIVFDIPLPNAQRLVEPFEGGLISVSRENDTENFNLETFELI